MPESMASQLVDEISNDNDVIEVEVPSRNLSLEFDIRDDSLTMFEGENGRLFLRPPEEELMMEVVPSTNGADIQPVSDVSRKKLTEIKPADPAEQPDVDSASADIIRMD